MLMSEDVNLGHWLRTKDTFLTSLLNIIQHGLTWGPKCPWEGGSGACHMASCPHNQISEQSCSFPQTHTKPCTPIPSSLLPSPCQWWCIFCLHSFAYFGHFTETGSHNLWPFAQYVSGLPMLQMHQDFTLPYGSTASHGTGTSHLPVHLLTDTWAISTSQGLWMVLLRIFMCKLLHTCFRFFWQALLGALPQWHFWMWATEDMALR